MDYFKELNSKRAASKEGGGIEKTAIQHSKSKMTARERIEYLLDRDSFVEIGALASIKGAGVITGYGTINNRLVYVYSEDFTIAGGLLNTNNTEKILNIMSMALKMGAPLIHILDSLGGDIKEGMMLFKSFGAILKLQSRLSGVIPQISVIAGPCTGTSAISACMSDVTIMTKNAELYMNAVETIETQSRTYSELSTYAKGDTGVKSGSIQMVTEDDKEAIDRVKTILSYLPQNNCEILGFDTVSAEEFIDEEINNLYISEKLTYKDLLKTIADDGLVTEIGNGIDSAIHTSFVNLRGLSVGVISSDSSKSKLINIKDCEKAVKFIKLCNTFNISILSLVDCKGFLGSAEEESKGLSLYAAKLVFALAAANVPKVSLIVGNSIGTGHLALASKETSFDITYAFPSAVISLGEPSQIVNEIYREEILLSDSPKQKEKELFDKVIKEEFSAFKASEEGHVDDIIKPSEARTTLIRAFDMLQSKREVNYPRKHGSVLI
jgi:acetyl-CoA carboxylase carboxyltransferase component